MTTTYPAARRRPIMALLMALALLLAACSSSDATSATESLDRVAAPRDGIEATDGGSDGGREDSVEEQVGDDPASIDQEPTDAGNLGDGGVEPVALTAADLGRDIIFTAEITSAVNDVAAAGEEATRIIQGMGGIVFGQRTIGSPDPTSVLTFKVFPADFQNALDRLGSVGELRSQSVSADDVTERVVDIQSRINTAEASVERLRGFLDGATDIQTIADLENQLLERETVLETLRGQLRTIQDQVSLATIVLTLVQANSQPLVGLIVTAYPGHDGAGSACPGQSPLEVDEGEDVTVCFEISNQGDTLLTDLTLTDTILDLDLEDLVTVYGDPAADLQPGETVMLATEIVVERDIRTRTTVTAAALDDDGELIPTRNATATVSHFIDSVDPGGIPGFSDGIETSWELLVSLSRLAVLFAGAALPFIWVIPLVWWLRRRRIEQAGTSAAVPAQAPPAGGTDPVDAPPAAVSTTGTAPDRAGGTGDTSVR